MSGQFCDFCVLGIEIYVFIFVVIVQWCNGSTPDFGSVSPGSSPGWTTESPAQEVCAGLFLFIVVPMIGVKLVFVEIHEKRVENVVMRKGRFARVATWAAEDVQESDRL